MFYKIFCQSPVRAVISLANREILQWWWNFSKSWHGSPPAAIGPKHVPSGPDAGWRPYGIEPS